MFGKGELKALAILVIAIVLMATPLIGCTSGNGQTDLGGARSTYVDSQEKHDPAGDQFGHWQLVDKQDASGGVFVIETYRDTLTDVMYVAYRSSYSNGGASLSVLYNADGAPLTYQEYIALADK